MKLKSFGLVTLPFSLVGCVFADGSKTIGQDEAQVTSVQQALTCDASLEQAGTRYYYVAPDGNDSNGGSCQAPLATLQRAEQLIRSREGITLVSGLPTGGTLGTGAIAHPYTVYIRRGTYLQQSTNWRAASASGANWVKILAYPHETPVFDGEGKVGRAFQLNVRRGERTKLQISGITWRHYKDGISFRGGSTESEWNGGGIISDNVFEEIGDEYDDGYCVDYLQAHPGGDCFGAAVIGLRRSRYNTVERNIIVRAASRDSSATFGGGSRKVMHALYLSEYAKGNVIQDNSISLVSGTPINLRWESNDNQIRRNYITDSGQQAFFACWGEPDSGHPDYTDYQNGARFGCRNNTIEDNVLTFGYPWVDSNPARCQDPIELQHIVDADNQSDYVDGGQLFVEGRRPKRERIGGLVAADLGDDGRNEVVVALNYDEIGVSKVVSSDGTHPYLSRILSVTSHQTNGLVAGDFDWAGTTLVTYTYSPAQDVGRLTRGFGLRPLPEATFGDATNELGEIWSNDGWTIDAMAAGDFEGTGSDQLTCAMTYGQSTSIYRGTGVSSIGTRFYGPNSYWQVHGMTAGDFDGDGVDSLVTAFYHRSTSGSTTLRLYTGNGVSSATSGGYFYASSSRDVRALAAPPIAFDRIFSAWQDLQSELPLYELWQGPVSSAVLDNHLASSTSAAFTHLAPTANRILGLVLATGGATANQVTANGVVYHRWDKPPQTTHCN